MKELIQVPAELTDYKTYKTKPNLNLTFELQENLQPEDLAKIIGAKGVTGWLAFNPTTEQRLEIEDIPTAKLEAEAKTPSQRLRNVLYVLYKEKGITDPFTNYYAAKMEQFIDHVKAQLPEQNPLS